MSVGFIDEVSTRHGLTNMHPLHGGEGGMGKIYVADQPRLGRRIAIKRLSTDKLRTDASRATGEKRFQQEMQILGNLHKESIVVPIDSGITSQGIPYFTMTFVSGEDLQTVIQRRINYQEPFTPEEAASILEPIAEALDYIHTRTQPIVHRDVKPANIIIPNDQNFTVKSVLTDFGIAIKKNVNRLTATNVSVGTEMYMAPESYMTANPSSDNYALALVAYEMITLRPFKRPTVDSRGKIPRAREFNEDLGSRSLNRVFSTALAVKEKDRYPTCRKFLAALRRAKPPKEPEETAFETRPYEFTKTAAAAVRDGGSKKWLWAVGAVVVLGLASIPILNGENDTWTEQEQAIVKAFPSIVPEAPGKSPWKGFSCNGSTGDDAEYTSITCDSRRGTVVLADFGDVRQRARFVSNDGAQTLVSDTCTVRRANYGENFALLPQGDKQRFAILISGKNAEQLSLEVPLC